MRAITKAVIALALLAGPADAQARPDPMRDASLQAGTISQTDPMVALRAPTEAAPDGPAANAELGGLPDAPGAEETYYQCVACHSTDIIKQQRITDARWDELWQWMVEEQGMFEPDPETRDVILAYLKTQFSSER
ncbi:cytochrome C-552 [Paracoccus sp. 11-3]|uniref:Cytochrome C-552 n=1 Tax=Paracoccus amoyensis TaxID=2760093 RepID=A0A926G5Z3_9RHOB|nr:cytochrome C-552 [Paracoccus amoyensis]MBC9245193.1 cytochrome C-552 [Paracoccus amoyensis]